MAETLTGTGSMDGGYVNTGSKPGPVLTMMSKRLRAMRKKLTKIDQIEKSKGEGKSINKEQEQLLESKTSVMILIEEYERLQKPLEVSVKEELLEREKDLAAAAAIQRSAGYDDKGAREAKDSSKEANGVSDNSSGPAASREEKSSRSSDHDVSDLLKLLYFAHLFDVRSQGESRSLVWTKEYERSSCLSYDYVPEEAPAPLSEGDLDAIAALGTMLTSRPPNVTLSHKDALNRCVEHAKRWLMGSDDLVGESSDISYSHLRERLNKILSSEYFTVTPELQTAAVAAGQYVADAAAAAGHEIGGGQVVITEEQPTYYAPQEQAGPPVQYYQQEYLPSHPQPPYGTGAAAENQDYSRSDQVEYPPPHEDSVDEGGVNRADALAASAAAVRAQQQAPMISTQQQMHHASQQQQQQQMGALPSMMPMHHHAQPGMSHQIMGMAPPHQYMGAATAAVGGMQHGGVGLGPSRGASRGGYRGRGSGGYDGMRGGGRRGGARSGRGGPQGGMPFYEPHGFNGAMGGRGSGGRGRSNRGRGGGGSAVGPVMQQQQQQQQST